MPSTYTNILRLELQADGENDGTWGQILNDNVIALIEDAVAGTASISTTGGTTTLSTNDGADDQARRKVLDVSGSLGSDAIIEVPAQSKTYVVRNRTSGSQTVEVLVAGQSAGNGVVVPQGETQSLYCDGSDVEPAAPAIPRGNEAALFDSDLAANGGSIPEEGRENNFTARQDITAISGTGDGAYIHLNDSNGNTIGRIVLRDTDGSGGGHLDFDAADGLTLQGNSAQGSGTINIPNHYYENGTRVVESGSNSDGYWVRYSDGTQIAFFDESDGNTASTSNVSSSGVSRSATVNNDDYEWTFPKSFNASPAVTSSVSDILAGSNVFEVGSTSAGIGIFQFDGDNVTYVVSATAVGTWT
jgi:hypothetical protein